MTFPGAAARDCTSARSPGQQTHRKYVSRLQGGGGGCSTQQDPLNRAPVRGTGRQSNTCMALLFLTNLGWAQAGVWEAGHRGRLAEKKLRVFGCSGLGGWRAHTAKSSLLQVSTEQLAPTPFLLCAQGCCVLSPGQGTAAVRAEPTPCL